MCARGPALDLDLAALIVDEGLSVVAVRSITTLPSVRTRRATVRLELACGRALKGRVLRTEALAREVRGVADRLAGRGFARVLARRGAALLEEWIEGAPLGARATDPAILAQAGALLGDAHLRATPGDAVSIDARLAEAASDAARLVAAGALDERAAARALDLCRAFAPAAAARGPTLRDLCPDNLVLDAGGILWCIDSGSFRFAALDEDLARTWYRWPMAPPERRALLEGYGARRDQRPFVDAFPFWGAAVLLAAARRRVMNALPRAHVPLDRLAGLLARCPESPARADARALLESGCP